MRAFLLVAVLGACGHSADPASGASQGHPEPASGAAVAKDAQLEVPARPLGLADLASYQWRKRPGQASFSAARKAEHREDWPGVATAAGQAFATDPGHLEAAWLYAVALAKTGKLDAVLAPLQVAEAGDFGKWGQASLEQPALQAWLATPIGEAWRRRVDDDRATYTAALSRSVFVTAHGDLFAVDPSPSPSASPSPTSGRWYRLTRTYGAVAVAYYAPAAHHLAYVTRGSRKAAQPGALSLGVVDLARGRSSRPVPVGAMPPVAIAAASSVWVGIGGAWKQIDDDGHFHPQPAKTPRPAGAWLEVFAHTARLHRLPVADVTADFDDQSLASAIRIGTSNRIVSVPSPGLIDGNTATWSPDHAHLAFVAQLDDHCTPGTPGVAAAAFVADAATGTLHELERATNGLAVEWVGDRRLAIAGDHGVTLISLDGGAAPQAIEGADGLVTPRRKPKCTPEASEPTEEPSEPDEMTVE